jgi:GMP synthase-like glutamine amidotransferase
VVIPLGSEFAPYQNEIPWISREVELIRQVHLSGRSVFGICFGGQLLARALGGSVYRAQRSEIGWVTVDSRDPELVSVGPWFQWHFDTFQVPPGADIVAANDVGPQAYVVGRSMGLQFHPEITLEILDDWMKTYRHELDQEGVDPGSLRKETEQFAGESAARARHLFDGFLARVANEP